MIDFIASVLFFGFFGFLIYATVIRRNRNEEKPIGGSGEVVNAPRPSQVSVFCSICHTEVSVMSMEEYIRFSRIAAPVYCQWCARTIEMYKAQQAHRVG